MKIITLIILILLSGCDIDNNNHGFGYDYDFITDSGIYFIDHADSGLTNEIIEADYAALTECVGGNADPENITIVHSEIVDEFITSTGGMAVFDDGIYILLLPNNFDSQFDLFYLRQTLKHELIHYILYMTNGDGDISHQSPYFINCIY